MRYLFTVFPVLFSFVSFGQKKCDCELKNDFIRQRDYQSDTLYEQANQRKIVYDLKKQGSASCKAYSYHLLAAEKTELSDYQSALTYLAREKRILDSLGCKSVNYLEFYVASGDLHLRTGEIENSVKDYNSALSIMKRVENNSLRSRILLALSNAHSKLQKEELARGYLKQAHPLVIILPDGKTKVETLYALSARYYYQFQAGGGKELLDSARNSAQFGFDLARRIQYTEGFIRGYNLLEDKEYHDRNYRKALVYLDSALYFTNPAFHLAERNGIYADMADIYLELKQYDKAYFYADSSLFYARELANPFKVRDGLELLYNCSKLSGEYDRAMSAYQDLLIMRDSVLKIEIQNSAAFRDMEERYHRVRQEKSVAEYEQDQQLFEQQRKIDQMRNKLLTVGIVICALLGCYVFIVFRQKSLRSRQKSQEVERRLQRARINPDFIYNTLNNLQQQGDEGLSKNFALFSKLIKQSLESSHDDFLTLDKEIEFLTYYLQLQKDRFPAGFSFRFEVDEAIDQKDVCLPTMILQPFVENTVERGFSGLNYAGEIVLNFRQQDNELHVRISDNGKGLKAGSSSRAAEIMNERLLLMNRLNKDSASYIVRENSSGGVTVEILLPLISCEMAEARQKEL